MPLLPNKHILRIVEPTKLTTKGAQHLCLQVFKSVLRRKCIQKCVKTFFHVQTKWKFIFQNNTANDGLKERCSYKNRRTATG